jgi:hypothetical protein
VGIGAIFDLFSRLPDGSPLWLESVQGLEAARSRLNGLSRVRPGEYFIYSEKTGGMVGPVSEDNSHEHLHDVNRQHFT